MNIPIYFTLQQCDTVSVEDIAMPYMKSLYSCLNKIKGDGYTETFEKTSTGIYSIASNNTYLPKEYKIINSFRFEGNEKVIDNVIMYMIETTDGAKGTLVGNYDLADDKKMAG